MNLSERLTRPCVSTVSVPYVPSDLLSDAAVICHCRTFTMATALSRPSIVTPTSSTFPSIATTTETSFLAAALQRR